MLLVKKKLGLSRLKTILWSSIIKVNVFHFIIRNDTHLISLTGTVEFSQENITIWSAEAHLQN